LRAPASKSLQIAKALEDLHTKVKYCPRTFALIDADLDISPLYEDPRRNKKLIAVVEDPFDILSLKLATSG
jgi:recombinational DNA repair protein RecR